MVVTNLHEELNSGYFKQIGEKHMIKPTALVDTSGGLTMMNRTSIADNVILYTHKHDIHRQRWQLLPSAETLFPTPLVIEEFAYIGAGSIILGGVNRIGKNSFVGAGSVLTHSVPDNEIWAGNPAKKIGDVIP